MISSRSDRVTIRNCLFRFTELRPQRAACQHQCLEQRELLLLHHEELQGGLCGVLVSQPGGQKRSRWQCRANEYFLAKFGVDTEENEPYEVCSFG